MAGRPLVTGADVREQRPLRCERHFVVEVKLVGPHAGSGIGDRRHVVVPAGTIARTVPVGRPAVVRGIDVRGQRPRSVPSLIGPEEVHLAGQDGAVAGAAQVVGEGGDLGAEFRRVVVAYRCGTAAARSSARPQAGAPAGWRCTRRRRTTPIRPARQEAGTRGARVTGLPWHGSASRGQLISDDQQDVRASACAHRLSHGRVDEAARRARPRRPRSPARAYRRSAGGCRAGRGRPGPSRRHQAR